MRPLRRLHDLGQLPAHVLGVDEEDQRPVRADTRFAEHADVPHLVVTFLAVLELVREQLVDVTQAEPYAPIHVHAKGETAFALAAENE